MTGLCRTTGNIAYAAYFDVNGLWPTQIDNEQFPKSQKLFRKLFQRRILSSSAEPRRG